MTTSLGPRSAGRTALFWALALSVAGTGCIFSSDDEKKKADDDGGFEYLPRTSPENVIENLEASYRNRDLDGYVDQLDPEFVFAATDADVEVDFDQLSYDDEIATAENMFDNVDAITITLDHSGAAPSDRAEYPPEDGYLKLLVPSVRLDVLSRFRDEASGERITFRATGPALFIFAPDESTTPTEYRIVYQQDLFTGRLAGLDRDRVLAGLARSPR